MKQQFIKTRQDLIMEYNIMEEGKKQLQLFDEKWRKYDESIYSVLGGMKR